MLARRASVAEIAEYTDVRPVLIQRFIELGLIEPQMYYTEAELRELRCARRLIEDLGFDDEAIESLLRMRRRILALQREIAQLQAELRNRRSRESAVDWLDIVDGDSY